MIRTILINRFTLATVAIFAISLSSSPNVLAQAHLDYPTDPSNLSPGSRTLFQVTIPAIRNGNLADPTTVTLVLKDDEDNIIKILDDGVGDFKVVTNGPPENPTSFTVSGTITMPLISSSSFVLIVELMYGGANPE